MSELAAKFFKCFVLTTTSGDNLLEVYIKITGHLVLTPFCSKAISLSAISASIRVFELIFIFLSIYLVDKCSIMAHDYISDQ